VGYIVARNFGKFLGVAGEWKGMVKECAPPEVVVGWLALQDHADEKNWSSK
jgi:hypothetical protein